MEEDTSVMELSLRLSALRKAFLLHVYATDAALRGHADLLAGAITRDLDALSPELRAWAYGMELQDLRAEILEASEKSRVRS
jgi:hypothetical protein